MTPLLAAFREGHPLVRFALTVDASTELARRLRDDGIEVASLLENAIRVLPKQDHSAGTMIC